MGRSDAAMTSVANTLAQRFGTKQAAAGFSRDSANMENQAMLSKFGLDIGAAGFNRESANMENQAALARFGAQSSAVGQNNAARVEELGLKGTALQNLLAIPTAATAFMAANRSGQGMTQSEIAALIQQILGSLPEKEPAASELPGD